MSVLIEDGTDSLQQLHDSEIDFELSSFGDGGFIWKLGDSANGYPAEGHVARVNEAISQLSAAGSFISRARISPRSPL
jgi:hypothetical protein